MFTGVFTALITPFTQKNKIDEPALRALVNRQIEAGISGLVPVGTTGESPTLSHTENIDVVRIVVEEAARRVPVVAGTGSNCTSEAVDMTRRAMEVGADGTLQVAPYYNKPNQEGLYRHFMTLADSVDLPLMVYNIPGRTAKNIETSTLMRMAKHPNIAAVKEASGDLSQMMDVIAQKPKDFDVLSGDDNLAFLLTAAGGSGVVSVASNIIPDKMEKLVSLAREAKLEEARRLHYLLMPLFKAMFVDTNPIPIKTAMAELGYCEKTFRLPLLPLDNDHIDSLMTTVKAAL